MSRQTGSRTDTKPLMQWEYQSIINRLPEHWQLVFRIMRETGIFVGEALAICRNDIQNCALAVKRERSGSRELLPLSHELYATLLKYAEARRTAHLFPYTPQAAWLALKKAVQDAGLRVTINPGQFRPLKPLAPMANAKNMPAAPRRLTLEDIKAAIRGDEPQKPGHRPNF